MFAKVLTTITTIWRPGFRGANWSKLKCEAFMSLHSLYEQLVWRCNYFRKINPKSNSISVVQIMKIVVRSACLIFKLVIEKGVLNQDHTAVKKLGKYGLKKVKCFPFCFHW